MVRRVREKATPTAVSKRSLDLMSKARRTYSSRQKLAFWLSALLVVVAVPASASAIRNHLDTSPPEKAETTGANNTQSNRSQTDASVRLETESRSDMTGNSATPPKTRTDTDVRVNGQPVPLSDDGRFNQTIETEDGRTNIDVRVRNNTSAGVQEEETDTRTRIRIDTDSDISSSVKEDLSVEIDE